MASQNSGDGSAEVSRLGTGSGRRDLSSWRDRHLSGAQPAHDGRFRSVAGRHTRPARRATLRALWCAIRRSLHQSSARGTYNPFAFITELRQIAGDKTIILAEAVSNGQSVAGAIAASADLVSIGTRFISNEGKHGTARAKDHDLRVWHRRYRLHGGSLRHRVLVALHSDYDSLEEAGLARPILARALSVVNIHLMRERAAFRLRFQAVISRRSRLGSSILRSRR